MLDLTGFDFSIICNLSHRRFVSSNFYIIIISCLPLLMVIVGFYFFSLPLLRPSMMSRAAEAFLPGLHEGRQSANKR